jgi:hypothetical protein
VFWYGTVRAFTKNQSLNGRSLVRAFKQKSRKTVKKERYAVRSTKTVSRGKRYGTLRYGHGTVWTRSADKFGLPSVMKKLLNRFFILLMKLIFNVYFYFFVWLLRPVLVGCVIVGTCEALPLDAAF